MASVSSPHDADSLFISRYYARLGLDATQLDVHPTLAKLRFIQEAHLARIPFENLSQHGCTQPASVRDVERTTAVKVLETNRGGFCFELNGLLAHLLTQLGYDVCRVSCFVAIEGVYRDVATHMVLIVTVPPPPPSSSSSSSLSSPDDVNSGSGSSLWLVDVGFGEPPLHPLSYDIASIWDQEQVTPEGMQSKLVRIMDETSGEEFVHLLWYRHETNVWMPRLKWKYHEALLGVHGPTLESFEPGLQAVLAETSVFGQKLICCLVNRTTKRTLAGSRLKVTGPPRFQPPSSSTTTTTTADVVTPIVCNLESVDQAREVLARDFGIPMDQSHGLHLTKSQAADPAIWAQM